MADTTTPILGLTKPEVGASDDLWGGKLNNNFDILDNLGNPVSWDDLIDKPSTFPPSTHSHIIADVTGLQTALDGKAATSHSHIAADVTDFSEAVDDRVFGLLVAGTNISFSYNDASNTFTINAATVIPDSDKGDIVVTSSGSIWTIDTDVVTNTKLANMATATIKGRTTAGTGDPEDLTGAQVLAITGAQPSNANLTSWAAITRASGFDTFVTTPNSVNLKALVTDETGSGALVFATSPTLVTPALGTPASGVLTNCTGLPTLLVANEAADTTCFPAFFTGATGELGPKTNANLTFNASTNVLSVGGSPVQTNATGQPLDATLTALAAFNTNGLLTQTAADTFAGRTVTGTANQVTVTNGNGVAGNPTISLDPADIIVPAILTVPNVGLHLLDTNASHDLIIKPGSDLSADRILTITTGDSARILTLSGDATLNAGSLSGTNTGDQTITLTGDVGGSGTGSFAATIAADAVSNTKLSNMATQTIKGRTTAATGDPEDLTPAQVLTMLGLPAGLAVSSITFMIDGGGAVITTGIKGDLIIPFACTITEWTLLGDQSGSIVVDVWKDTYANYPPVVGDTITASAKPTITTAVKGQSSTLTGWTTTIAAGDTLRFNVDSVATMQRVTLALKVTRT